MKSFFLECQCCSPEHTLKFIYDDIDKELYTEIYLGQYHGFWGRIILAIKYIFGYKCKYGMFDCFIFKNSDITNLRKLLEKIYENNRQKNN